MDVSCDATTIKGIRCVNTKIFGDLFCQQVTYNKTICKANFSLIIVTDVNTASERAPLAKGPHFKIKMLE